MNHADQATFFRAALLLGLIRGERVVAWADAVIARDPSAAAAFIDISICPPDDLTGLRQRLLLIGPEKETDTVARALAGLVHRDLASGRRTIGDTMTVLKQLRAFVGVSAGLNDQLKTLGVDVAMSQPDTRERAEAYDRVRAWLARHDADAVPFLE
jgi:hypothetical protein